MLLHSIQTTKSAFIMKRRDFLIMLCGGIYVLNGLDT